MENEKVATYYMLLEEYNQNKPSKVQFGKFVKVLEFYVPKREKNPSQLKVNELRNIAKMLEQIDGGLKPSKNNYKAKIDSSGLLTDLQSGKTLKIPMSKLNSISSQFSSILHYPIKTKSLLPRLTMTPGTKLNLIKKKPLRFPSLNRIKKTHFK